MRGTEGPNPRIDQRARLNNPTTGSRKMWCGLTPSGEGLGPLTSRAVGQPRLRRDRGACGVDDVPGAVGHHCEGAFPKAVTCYARLSGERRSSRRTN